ncbi:hypothetical protein COCC4DRAFT_153632 [Bipolaris maydis ATCC 48331]|uniref:Uncharacterized protein n=2 Tax=Cochliobolus heterostrophus TaxID=5016 RepID=M2V184_COCH5|nr:uncharacterized protein COCC4DRAFT_153632 [Bipolaris maydis ATCC 48331]EMD93712.1 hypothetical protein COCHEDRAFT_1028855 [Bipolaris maydis C5]KAH7562608.1 hypothetical protein BM1_02128 [Bipolaris maydis]ENH99286.1 hypothetical protein COCC4DRAFT_153632 [Bipolaris maydis ATCC 48331]KAJ5028000.1 hypothetical protein J3E73DRAFT_389926 [Bipolaris maydis]KAJ5062772.1 hypothetical protein J3E74DRAFT_404398 [Bipolaris maydis]
MENIKIHLGQKQVWVDAQTFRAWFPKQKSENSIQGDLWVQRLHNYFNGHFGIRKEVIQKTLEQFFGILGPYAQHGNGETRHRVRQVLQHYLDQGCLNNAYRPKDLQWLRHTFIILVQLARKFESSLLAEALSTFWGHTKDKINRHEKSEYLADWKKAAEKVQESYAVRPLAAFIQQRRSRARPAPVVKYGRRKVDFRLEVPAFANPAWAPPVNAPVRYSRDECFDKLNNIQHQQREMKETLENVNGKLDRLIRGTY